MTCSPAGKGSLKTWRLVRPGPPLTACTSASPAPCPPSTATRSGCVCAPVSRWRERIMEALAAGAPGPAADSVHVGIPRAMSTFDRYPFWQRYFAELGIRTVLSPVTDPRIAAAGVDMAVAQPCYPVQVDRKS